MATRPNPGTSERRRPVGRRAVRLEALVFPPVPRRSPRLGPDVELAPGPTRAERDQGIAGPAGEVGGGTRGGVETEVRDMEHPGPAALGALGVAAQHGLCPFQLLQTLRPGGLRQPPDRPGPKAHLERRQHGEIGDPERGERRLGNVRGPHVAVVGQRRADREPDHAADVHGHPAPVPDPGVQLAGIEPPLDEVDAAVDLGVRQAGGGTARSLGARSGISTGCAGAYSLGTPWSRSHSTKSLPRPRTAGSGFDGSITGAGAAHAGRAVSPSASTEFGRHSDDRRRQPERRPFRRFSRE